jgi:hypothetical protein
VLIRSKTFCSRRRPVPLSNGSPIQWLPGSVSPGVNRQGREADHLLPTRAEIKETCYLRNCSHTRLHDFVLNYLSTGTTLLAGMKEHN